MIEQYRSIFRIDGGKMSIISYYQSIQKALLAGTTPAYGN